MTVKPKIELTPEVAMELLERAVERRGEDFVYEQFEYAPDVDSLECRYAYQNAPSCLVGEVLHEAGITINALNRFDSGQLGKPSCLVRSGALNIPAETARLLDAAQEAQDGGENWGKALQMAKAYAAAGFPR